MKTKNSVKGFLPNPLRWLLRIMAAGILAQTLFFKFSAAPESVYIFSTLGLEPWGRIGSGVAELIAAAMLITPRLSYLGAILASGVMVGAIGSHLTRLGIVVQNDGGLLFTLALTVFVSSLVLIYDSQYEIKNVYTLIFSKRGA